MMAVSVCQMLQPHAGIVMKRMSIHTTRTSIVSPRKVLESLDREFPINALTGFSQSFMGFCIVGQAP